MLKPTKNIWRIKRYLTIAIKKSQGVSCLCPYDVEARASWSPPGYAPGLSQAHQDSLSCFFRIFDNYQIYIHFLRWLVFIRLTRTCLWCSKRVLSVYLIPHSHGEDIARLEQGGHGASKFKNVEVTH